jgi:rare lipoprotein A
MRSAGATWYGPGFYGGRTACGQTLRPGTIGVAHRSLPCGTLVRFAYHGRSLVARVIDRGPYTDGNEWDLTNGARMALGFESSGLIRCAVALKFARR